jgi:hypothetical protein
MANIYARKMLSKADGISDINKNINVLETLVTTLKEVALSETHEEAVDEFNTIRRVVLRSAQAVDNQVETVIRQIKLKGNPQNE